MVGGWIRAEGGCKGGENCLKHLKRGWNRKEGRGNKDFKKVGQAGSRDGCLKKGEGAGTPLQTMGMRIEAHDPSNEL